MTELYGKDALESPGGDSTRDDPNNENQLLQKHYNTYQMKYRNE